MTEEAWAGPGDQSPRGSWWNMGVGPGLMGEKIAVQAVVVPRREGASRISERSGLV